MQPTVVCVMLVSGREAMVRRAIRSFEAQTYKRKRLLIWDSTPGLICCDQTEHDGVFHVPAVPRSTIGTLRNEANSFWNAFDIFIHWDSDDYSHPNRIAEQVALLQSSGKEAVGYRDMLFWNETPGQFCGAWLYTNHDKSYCLGTSLCYWRKTWERRPFPDAPKAKGATGEDTLWIRELDSLGVKSTYGRLPGEPRMIASIHGDNTQDYNFVLDASPSWRRAPEWDDYTREKMAL